jgi:hypothetical protein
MHVLDNPLRPLGLHILDIILEMGSGYNRVCGYGIQSESGSRGKMTTKEEISCFEELCILS